MDVIVKGSGIKLNVSLAVDGVTMDEMDFVCRFYCKEGGGFVDVDKGAMRRVDEMNYLASVDTSGVGAGVLMMRVQAVLYDVDFSDGHRTEVGECETGIMIVN